VPGQSGLSDALMALSESEAFPAKKNDVVGYITDNGSAELASWLSATLPEGSYKDPGDVILAVTPPIEWKDVAGGSSLLWRPDVKVIGSGTKLIIAEGQ